MVSISRATKPDGRVILRWREPDGKQPSRTVGSDAEADAMEAVVAERLRGLFAEAKAKGLDKRKAGELQSTFRQVAEKRLQLITNERTRYRTRRRLEKHVFPVIGDIPVRELENSPTVIAECIIGWPGQTSSKLTIFRSMAAVFDFAKSMRLIGYDPCEDPIVKLKRPKDPKKTIKPWADEQIAEICHVFRKDVRIYPLLGAFCGLRQGEIFGLSPDDIGFNERGERVIFVRRQVITTTTGRRGFAPPKLRDADADPREVPLPDHVWESIQEFVAYRKPLAVTLPFDRGDGSLPTPMTVRLFLWTREDSAWRASYFNNSVWAVALQDAGIPRTRENGSHALRHWFAKYSLENKVSVSQLSQWMGHAKSSFTMDRYGRFSPTTTDALRELDEGARALLGRRPSTGGSLPGNLADL